MPLQKQGRAMSRLDDQIEQMAEELDNARAAVGSLHSMKAVLERMLGTEGMIDDVVSVNLTKGQIVLAIALIGGALEEIDEARK
jgi:hypothetical protein